MDRVWTSSLFFLRNENTVTVATDLIVTSKLRHPSNASATQPVHEVAVQAECYRGIYLVKLYFMTSDMNCLLRILHEC